MRPLTDWTIGGYTFGSPTFYSAHHLGVDLHAPNLTPLYAPFNGVVLEAFTGREGGKTIWFKPDHDDVIMRFLHLDYFVVKKGERVTEGEQIALTGNTGRIVGSDGKVHTYAPHLHLDISRGSVVLSWPGNFIDPETYAWDLSPTPEPEPVPTPSEPIEVPISFWIEVAAPLGRANFRKEPTTASPVMVTYGNGERIECIATVQGELVSVTDRSGRVVTSDKWYRTKRSGWNISATVAKHL